MQIPLQLKVPVRLCLKATAWSWIVLFSFQLYRLSFILILFVPSKLVSFSLNLTSDCVCVFSENCFCITLFLMETDPPRIYTRVAYNLLHLLIYCFHLPSTSLRSFVIFSCSVRNFKPSASIYISRRASNCPLYCLRLTRVTVFSSNG